MGTQQEVGEEGRALRRQAKGERPLTNAPPATRGRRDECERRQIRCPPGRRDVKEKFPSGPRDPDRSTCGFTLVTMRSVRHEVVCVNVVLRVAGVSESSRPEAHGSGVQTHPVGEGLVLPAPCHQDQPAHRDLWPGCPPPGPDGPAGTGPSAHRTAESNTHLRETVCYCVSRDTGTPVVRRCFTCVLINVWSLC